MVQGHFLYQELLEAVGYRPLQSKPLAVLVPCPEGSDASLSTERAWKIICIMVEAICTYNYIYIYMSVCTYIYIDIYIYVYIRIHIVI